MNLEVRKYKVKDEIIINCFDTWSIAMQNLIKDNYKIIDNYRKRNEEMYFLREKYKRENNIDKIYELRNEYYNNYDKLKQKFYEILLSEDKSFICFHASRYTEKEKDRIFKEGLRTSSKDNLYNRIENLLYDGYIDEDEMNFLKEHHLLANKNNMRENQIWVTLGNVNISYSNDSGLMNVYDNYGGEIQYFYIEKFQIGSKLNNLSKPYLVVVKLRPSQIVEYELRNLIYNLFNNVCFENSEKVESEFFTEEENVIVEDIIEVDENSKIII